MSTETSTATNGAEPADPGPRPDPRPLSVGEVCRLLRVGPTAIPVLAENSDITVRLPAARFGYCPQLDDVQVVRLRSGLTGDIGLLATLRLHHPPETLDRHWWRTRALGGVLRVLGR